MCRLRTADGLRWSDAGVSPDKALDVLNELKEKHPSDSKYFAELSWKGVRLSPDHGFLVSNDLIADVSCAIDDNL